MEKQKDKTVGYIIKFLLQGNDDLAGLVGYTSNEADYHRYKVVIEPSGFFDDVRYGTPHTVPSLPLSKIEGLDLLFGIPSMERRGSTLLVKADIIASSFFLLSRYEEFACPDRRDIHGRFDGRESLAYRAGFITRPLVDEYGKLLRDWLRSMGENPVEPPAVIDKIYLTHDVDALGLFQTPNTALRGLYRSIFKNERTPPEVLRAFCRIDNDPAYTFRWLVEQDNSIADADKIFFFKALKRSDGYDRPHYSIKSKKVKRLLHFLDKQGCCVGLHSSYYSAATPRTLVVQNRHLSETVEKNICLHRSHYLTVLPPDMPQPYIDAGITDDFTLAYASVAGFRLGTCRAVHWINPANFSIAPILLHPLTVMDGTLSNKAYMGLEYDEALEYCKRLLIQVRQHNGQAVLLWHNTSVATGGNNYQSKLYEDVLNFLR